VGGGRDVKTRERKSLGGGVATIQEKKTNALFLKNIKKEVHSPT